MNTNELYHHGTKGQKWGIRKYQNPDGSLTPEGRERYGRNGTPISNNTRARIKQGGKLGAKIGAGVGVVTGGLAIGNLASVAAATGAVVNPVAAVGIGALFIGSYAATGALRGATYGAIYGAAETHSARKYIESLDTKKTKMKDLKE